ncbi:hypothetical protein HQ545_06920 [Candidatus Woesearchaeota archaeon]|nr:hypothetical protein [Candidatus Woesearchaeota archaeon]
MAIHGRCKEIKEETRQKKEKELRRRLTTVPSSIFLDRDLAPLESITEYLKEEKDMTYHEIALLVGRNDKTIWTCYSRARKKRSEKEKIALSFEDVIEIPIDIFKNRTLAPLESITSYLKDNKGLSFHEIAVLLNRDDRTIWTCHNRAKKKFAS